MRGAGYNSIYHPQRLLASEGEAHALCKAGDAAGLAALAEAGTPGLEVTFSATIQLPYSLLKMSRFVETGAARAAGPDADRADGSAHGGGARPRRLPEPDGRALRVGLGLGRIVVMHYRSSTLYHIR
jgi:hypothetical protein